MKEHVVLTAVTSVFFRVLPCSSLFFLSKPFTFFRILQDTHHNCLATILALPSSPSSSDNWKTSANFRSLDQEVLERTPLVFLISCSQQWLVPNMKIQIHPPQMTPYSSPVLSPLRGSVERTKHLQELIASVDSGGRTKLRLRFRLFLCLHSVSCIPDSPFIRQTDSIILRPSMQQVKCSNTLVLNNKLKLCIVKL